MRRASDERRSENYCMRYCAHDAFGGAGRATAWLKLCMFFVANYIDAERDQRASARLRRKRSNQRLLFYTTIRYVRRSYANTHTHSIQSPRHCRVARRRRRPFASSPPEALTLFIRSALEHKTIKVARNMRNEHEYDALGL